MLSDFPSEKQIKYMKDYTCVIYNNVNYILDSNYEPEYRKLFSNINDNQGVAQFFDYIRHVAYVLYNVYQSIDQKNIIQFIHLIKKDEFIEKYEVELKKNYEQLCKYIVLPEYNILLESIIVKIKQ